MLTPTLGTLTRSWKGHQRPRLGTLVRASPAAPPPKAHLTASPVLRKRWMALSAAFTAAWARELSIAAAREARHRRYRRHRRHPRHYRGGLTELS